MGAKVAWSSICYLLKEGDLGLKSLKTWNRAATMKHMVYSNIQAFNMGNMGSHHLTSREILLAT